MFGGSLLQAHLCQATLPLSSKQLPRIRYRRNNIGLSKTCIALHCLSGLIHQHRAVSRRDTRAWALGFDLGGDSNPSTSQSTVLCNFYTHMLESLMSSDQLEQHDSEKDGAAADRLTHAEVAEKK